MITQSPQAPAKPMRANFPPVRTPSGPYQALARRLRALPFDRDAGCTIVGFTSCAATAGVTTVAANTAICAAMAGGQSVLLIDANDTRPSLARLFGLAEREGLFNVLAGTASPVSCLQSTSVEHLTLLTAGSLASRQVVNFDPNLLREACRTWRQMFGLIIVDLPPANELTPCTTLASELDGVLLVVEADQSRRADLLHAKEQLAAARAKLLGAVFNKQRRYVPQWLDRFV